MSWLINFGVLNMRQPIVAQIWDGSQPPAGTGLWPDPPHASGDGRPRPCAAGRGAGALRVEIILRNNMALFL